MPAPCELIPVYNRRMPALKAVVKNGRLVLDEPTELPEGTEVVLITVDEPSPDSFYEPVSSNDLDPESSAQQISLRDLDPDATDERPTTPPDPHEDMVVSPRAPARSLIARRHLATLSRTLLGPSEDAELAAAVREATARAATHLRQLEDAPEGENYVFNAKEALVHARRALSLLQPATATNAALLPALEEAASAVGMIFSLLS